MGLWRSARGDRTRSRPPRRWRPTPSSTRARSRRRRGPVPARSAFIPTPPMPAKLSSAHSASRNDPELRRLEDVRAKAQQNAEDRLLDILLPPRPIAPDEEPAAPRDAQQQTRERFREQLRAGRLDARVVELDVREKAFPSFEIIAGSSVEEVDINLKDMLPGLFQGKNKKRKLKVPEALEYLTQEEEQKLIDMDSVARTAVERVEQAGIIFVDEVAKNAGPEGGHGPDVSREGVQRDILPIVEGTTVNTRN